MSLEANLLEDNRLQPLIGSNQCIDRSCRLRLTDRLAGELTRCLCG